VKVRDLIASLPEQFLEREVSNPHIIVVAPNKDDALIFSSLPAADVHRLFEGLASVGDLENLKNSPKPH
jgi:hypothetical protein